MKLLKRKLKPFELTQWWAALFAVLWVACGIVYLNPDECVGGVVCAIVAGWLTPLCRDVVERFEKDNQ